MTFPTAEVIRLAKVGKRSEDRVGAVTGCISALVAAILTALLNGFVVMVAVGAAHEWIPAIPPIGYWAATLVTLGVRTLMASITPVKVTK